MSDTTMNAGQIRPLAIDNSHIANTAAIVTSKLADAANFILRDGSIPFAQDQSMGGHKLTNLTDGVSSSDAVSKGQLDAAVAAAGVPFKFKPPARLAATGNITISNPGTSTFDGFTANNGDRIFLGFQTTASQKGIYQFNGSSSAMTRVLDFDAWTDIPAAFFAIEEGTLYGDTLWLNSNDDGGTIGSTAITFIQLPTSAGYSNSNFVTGETLGGTINGSNDTFTLTNTPTSGSQAVYYNGMRLRSGAGNDYTISGNTVTWIRSTMPVSGDYIAGDYRK